MIVQIVRFRSGLREDEVARVMEERAPRYRAIRGLIQKYYVHDERTGEFGGFYVWDSEESLEAFRRSDLARTIAQAYEVEGQSRTDTLDVIFPLRQDEAGRKAA